MIRVVTLAAAAIVSARLVAAQAAPHDRGDSVAVELTVVLAGGDPVSSAWTRWVTPRPHGGGAGVASTRVWRARATVDTRLPATAMSDGRAGPVVRTSAPCTCRSVRSDSSRPAASTIAARGSDPLAVNM